MTLTGTDVRSRPNDNQKILFLRLFDEGNYIESKRKIKCARARFVHVPRDVHRNLRGKRLMSL